MWRHKEMMENRLEIQCFGNVLHYQVCDCAFWQEPPSDWYSSQRALFLLQSRLFPSRKGGVEGDWSPLTIDSDSSPGSSTRGHSWVAKFTENGQNVNQTVTMERNTALSTIALFYHLQFGYCGSSYNPYTQ